MSLTRILIVSEAMYVCGIERCRLRVGLAVDRKKTWECEWFRGSALELGGPERIYFGEKVSAVSRSGRGEDR